MMVVVVSFFIFYIPTHPHTVPSKHSVRNVKQHLSIKKEHFQATLSQRRPIGQSREGCEGGSDATLTAEPPSPGPVSTEPRPHPLQAWGQVHGSGQCPSPEPPGTPFSQPGRPAAAPGEAPGRGENAVGSCRGPAIPASSSRHVLCMKTTGRNFILIPCACCVRELLRRRKGDRASAGALVSGYHTEICITKVCIRMPYRNLHHKSMACV